MAEERMDLGKWRKAAAKYLKNGGIVCPNCGSEDIEGDSVDIDVQHATQPLHCLVCEEEWDDLYTLTGVRAIPEGCDTLEYFFTDTPQDGMVSELIRQIDLLQRPKDRSECWLISSLKVLAIGAPEVIDQKYKELWKELLGDTPYEQDKSDQGTDGQRI